MAIAKAQPKKPPISVPKSSPYAYSGSQAKVTPVKPPVIKAPAVVAPAPVVNGGGGGGGGAGAGVGQWNPGPNYGADLVAAPDFTEANARYEENLLRAHDQRRLRVRAALIRLGFQPGSADAKALEGIDPSTAELAQNNSASALAQLGLKRGTDRADLSAELAARGMLDSGALRGGENMVQSSYDKGLLGATQDYLNEQNTALGDEATSLDTGQSTYTAAKAAAANAAAVNPLFRPTVGAGMQWDTLAPGQGERPDQTPVLAKAPPLTKPLTKPPVKVVPKAAPKPKPKPVINTKKPLY